MKIVHIFTDYPGNYQPYNKVLINSQRKSGMQVIIFSTVKVMPNNQYINFIPIVDSTLVKIFSFFRYFKNIIKLKTFSHCTWVDAINCISRYKSLLNYRDNLFHLHHIQMVHGMLLIFLKCFKVKYVLTVRGSDIGVMAKLNTNLKNRFLRALNESSGIHAISNNLKTSLINLGIDNEKITVIPRQILQIENLKHKQNKNIELLTVGRIHWIKGYPYILKALRKFIRHNHTKVHLNICGSGAQKHNENQTWNDEDYHLRYLINLYNLNDNVTLHGFLEYDELLHQFNNANIYLCGSLYEGLNTSILNALSYALVVIAPNVGGITDYINNDKNGLLYKTGSASGLYKCMVKAIEEKWVPEYNIPPDYPDDIAIINEYRKLYSSLL